MSAGGQEIEVARKKEIILKFVTGSHRVPQKSAKVPIGASAAAFGDVRWDRNRRASHLISNTPCLPASERCRNRVRSQRQSMRFLPHAKFPVVLHATSSLTEERSAIRALS